MDTDSLKFEAFQLRQRIERIVRRRGIVESHIAIRAVAILSVRVRLLEVEIRKGNT